MIVVSSGKKYLDIDGVACAIAYQELLTLQGEEAIAVFSAPLNQSVTPLARKHGLPYQTTCPENTNEFVVVDVSDPDHFDPCVKREAVIEIFDHHAGFEIFWQEKLHEHAHIKMIGACATLIYEAYEKLGFVSRMSVRAANLLAIAIVSNTVSFKVPITSPRDHEAYEALLLHGDLPEAWIEQYFEEQNQLILKDISNATKDDTKIEAIPELDHPLIFGQLEFWNADTFLAHHLEEAKKALLSYDSPYWMFLVHDISKGISTIITEDDKIKNLLEKKLGVLFNGNTCKTKNIILRKIVLKSLRETYAF
jgi:inorganic pyrophosphatase/manganese-dependent inorganic pyrophosphatase